MRSRSSAPVARRCLRCLTDSRSAGRAASRFYGTVNSASPRGTRTPATALRPWERPETTKRPSTKASPTNSPQYGLPSVLLPAEAANVPTVHKIHIIGGDARSQLIAHALSGVYDSVQHYQAHGYEQVRYRNIQKAVDPAKPYGRRVLVPNEAPSETLLRDETDDSHIDHLVISGKCEYVIKAVETVQHRMDDDTTVCLITDGLGVLEHVRQEVFKPKSLHPHVVLGHLTTEMGYNVQKNAAMIQRPGKLYLTQQQSKRSAVPKTDFVANVRQALDLNPEVTTFDAWLGRKLPQVLFDAAVEPICVAYNMPYRGILSSEPARRMMYSLFFELLHVVEALPELATNSTLRNWVQSSRLIPELHSHVIKKGDQVGALVRDIRRNWPNDTQYTNGYFLRKAKLLGVPCYTNKYCMDMIFTKCEEAVRRNNHYIPFQDTTLPVEMEKRMRFPRGEFSSRDSRDGPSREHQYQYQRRRW